MDIRTMDMDVIIANIEQDFESLAVAHDSAADNELLWALGASDAEGTKMHTENVTLHRMLARMYRRMKDDALAFVETYEDRED